MSNVEEEYFRYWGEVGGTGRLQRGFSLYEEMRAMLEFQIKKKNPNLDEREIPWEVARIMYLSDEATQRLLSQARKEMC